MLCIHIVCLFSMLTDAPGKVVFNQAITTLTSITFSWTAPSDDNGAVVSYQIQYSYSGMEDTDTTTELKYTLEDLMHATRVQFSVSAVSICRVVGEPSTATETTADIRK